MTTLSISQIEEASNLVTKQLIQEIDSDNWIVNSASGTGIYAVTRADSIHAYDLYCKCKGWQFKKGEKDCKHCEAVRIYQKGNSKIYQKNSRSIYQQANVNQNKKGYNENEADYHKAKKKAEIQAWIKKTKKEILNGKS